MIPEYRLMLLKNSRVVGRFDRYVDIANFLCCNISEEGKISVLGITDTISYNMEEWSYSKAMNDFAQKRLDKVIRRKGYEIVRYVS